MTKYLVVEDMRFMWDDPTDIDVVDEFDTAEEAENYINTRFSPNLIEWEGQFHRIYWIVKKEVA